MSAAESGRILIGTASWSDPGFVERWYPRGMAASERLPWYAQHFEMVEVNSTFYAVPDAHMVERWSRSTPDGFVFNIKLHQLLSRHATAVKLLPPRLQREAATDARGKVRLDREIEHRMVTEILHAIAPLQTAGKLGTLLLQLSPSFSPGRHALEELRPLFAALADYRVAVEFRNRHWTEGETLAHLLDFLREHAVALVSVDTPAQPHFTIMPPDLDEITDPRVGYLRLHGRDAKAYTTGKTVAARFHYDYSAAEIEEVAQRSRKLAERTERVHVVFNNNALDYAPHAALRLRQALGQIAQLPARQAELL